ncbi:MAG: hypothetical protein WBX38_15240 [Candidatus Sulfotelmatobacter sp.]
MPPTLHAQDDPGDVPLGDVARNMRKKSVAPSETVIDNDNLPKVMQRAESLHASGSSPVFSLDPGSKNFRVSSPDVMCSLSFTAKNASLLSDPIMLDELPRSELDKLGGPASIDGDSLQVSVHNGSAWDLREVLIGLTIVRRSDPGETASYFGNARIVPAVAHGGPAPDSTQKQPDTTLLLRIKGSAAPAATATFRTTLNFALFPDQDWHWAIVKAKGVPPQPSAEAMPQPAMAQPAMAQPTTGAGRDELPRAQAQSPASTPPRFR